MYAFQSWLETKGQIALINSRFDVPFIGVYPEIYHGNGLKADTVVRYILQTPGVMATGGVPGPTSFDKTDKIYVFSRLYDSFGVDDDHILFCPVINLHLFKDLKKKRTKTCYLVGKGVNQHKHPSDSLELTRVFASDQAALALVLNECQTLYCYDPISAMMDIARLCGCPVRYFGGHPLRELKKYEPGLEGIDFGQGSDFDPLNFRFHYQELREIFSKRLDYFIEDTQHG